MIGTAQRDDLPVGWRGRRSAVRRPLLHHPASLLQEITARIGCFGLVAERVRQRDFQQFSRRTGALAAPVTKCRSEPVYGDAVAAVTMQRLAQAHRDDRLGVAVDRDNALAGSQVDAVLLPEGVDRGEDAVAREDAAEH